MPDYLPTFNLVWNQTDFMSESDLAYCITPYSMTSQVHTQHDFWHSRALHPNQLFLEEEFLAFHNQSRLNLRLTSLKPTFFYSQVKNDHVPFDSTPKQSPYTSLAGQFQLSRPSSFAGQNNYKFHFTFHISDFRKYTSLNFLSPFLSPFQIYKTYQS